MTSLNTEVGSLRTCVPEGGITLVELENHACVKCMDPTCDHCSIDWDAIRGMKV